MTISVYSAPRSCNIIQAFLLAHRIRVSEKRSKRLLSLFRYLTESPRKWHRGAGAVAEWSGLDCYKGICDRRLKDDLDLLVKIGVINKKTRYPEGVDELIECMPRRTIQNMLSDVAQLIPL